MRAVPVALISAQSGEGRGVELAALTPAIHHLDDSDCDQWLSGSSLSCVTAVGFVFVIMIMITIIGCHLLSKQYSLLGTSERV